MAIEEELLRQRGVLLENIPVVTFHAEVTPEIRMVYVSPQLERLFGIPPSAWLSKGPTLMDWVHREDRERLPREVEAQLAHSDGYVVEFRLLTPGGPRWVRLHAGLVRA